MDELEFSIMVSESDPNPGEERVLVPLCEFLDTLKIGLGAAAQNHSAASGSKTPV